MKKTIFDLLEAFGLPYYRQGSAPEELHDTILTEWEIARDGMAFYDNEAKSEVRLYSICIYTYNVDDLAKLDDFCIMALREGYVIRQRPYDVPSGIEGCFGRACRISYTEKNLLSTSSGRSSK